MNSIPTPIAIVGMGLSGVSAKRLLLNLGVKPEHIATFDQKSPDVDFNNPDILIQEFQPKTLVVSPGVPLTTGWIQSFQKSGGSITSELAIAYDCLESERTIAITGSIGKSTTTSLLAAGAAAVDTNFFVGGNLGFPLANYISDVIEKKRTRAKWILLELSSYQLENCGRFQSNISCITYLTPNHLERYESLESYYSTKWALVERTKQSLILNQNGGDLASFSSRSLTPKSLSVVWTSREDSSLSSYQLAQKKLIGKHNEDNLALAIQISIAAGWPTQSVNLMKNYAGLPHRMENIGFYNQVLFINDSKATAIESVLTATDSVLKDLEESQTLYLLLGGKDKNLPWQDLSKLTGQSKVKFLFFGSCAQVAKNSSQLSGEIYLNLQAATKAACEQIRAKDVVLLSPGGTSLDEFKNFEDRGEKFKLYVKQFTQQKNN